MTRRTLSGFLEEQVSLIIVKKNWVAGGSLEWWQIDSKVTIMRFFKISIKYFFSALYCYELSQVICVQLFTDVKKCVGVSNLPFWASKIVNFTKNFVKNL